MGSIEALVNDESTTVPAVMRNRKSRSQIGNHDRPGLLGLFKMAAHDRTGCLSCFSAKKLNGLLT